MQSIRSKSQHLNPLVYTTVKYKARLHSALYFHACLNALTSVLCLLLCSPGSPEIPLEA